MAKKYRVVITGLGHQKAVVYKGSIETEALEVYKAVGRTIKNIFPDVKATDLIIELEGSRDEYEQLGCYTTYYNNPLLK